MGYFQMFPHTLYDAKGDGNYTVMKDILSRVKLVASKQENILNFDYYNVQDGETPEMIANKLYGDSNLHWVILYLNNVTDRYHQWPMTGGQFLSFLNDKYSNPDAVHHYEITQTSGDTEQTIDVGMNTTDYPSATAISNYTYEDRLQEQKRQIRLIHPRYISQIVEEFENKVDEML